MSTDTLFGGDYDLYIKYEIKESRICKKVNTNTLFGEDYVVHQVGYTNTDTSQSKDYGWSMKYVFTFAAAKAFSGKSILGKAYMAP